MNYYEKYLKYKQKYLELKNINNQFGGGKKYEFNSILKKLDNKYGIIIMKNNKVILEKYVGNSKDTRFRVFSLSKPITGLSIILLAQMNKLKLTDKISKYCINIPNNDDITINHLLYHSSGVYDFSSELYFKLNPKKLYNDILDKNETKFVDFETTVQVINENKPYFKPLEKSKHYNPKNYNNTGFDILGYIIYVVSGMKTDEFIKKYIFDKLKMNNSGFQHNKHVKESTPYEKDGSIGVKEQQNWFCGNAYISCTLRDYLRFMNGYHKLLKSKYREMYETMYWFGKNEKGIKFMWHFGAGDFNHSHKNEKDYNPPLSLSCMLRIFEKNNDISIIISENKRNKNGFFTNNDKLTYKYWGDITNIVEEKN